MVKTLKNTKNPLNITNKELQHLMKFMAGRTDFYWEYQNGVPFMVKNELTPEKLDIHFIGGNALGFSPFIDNKRIMFIGFDFDAHTSEDLTQEENEQLIKTAQEDAAKVFNFFKYRNMKAVLNSSGSSGRHVRLYCEGANAKDMRVYAHYVLDKVLGDCHKHEIFPKQDELNEDKKYGNQMKGYLCVHPKHKKRANIMAGDKVLDLRQSINVIQMTLDKENAPISFSEKDYNETVKKMNKTYTTKFDSSKFANIQKNTTLKKCNFIEEVATKYVLPSKNKYARHTCIDPNIQAYSYYHPEAKIKYAEVQGRHSDTAFRNWEKYWENGEVPGIKCQQIISYLKEHKDNNTCKLGLDACKRCPVFKMFNEAKNEPHGLANIYSITAIANKYNFKQCPKCKNNFKLNEQKGLYYCKACEYGGNLIKFIQLIERKSK